MTSSRHFRPVALMILTVLHSKSPNCYGTPINVTRSDLVLINTLVTDRQGRAITGLDASKFRLTEDGKEQVIRYFVSEDVPVSIGLVLDTSGSMSGQLAMLKQAAVQFVRAGNPADEYFLIEIRDRPRMVLPFTTDLEHVTQSIRGLAALGNRALQDALHLAVSALRRSNNPRKALLIISEGLDDHSRHTEKETKSLVSEVDFPIYTINVYRLPSGNRYTIQRRDTGILELISAPTGGRAFTLRDPKKLASVAELINSEIRHEYVLGYVPSSQATDGKFHRVHVDVGPSSGTRYRISNRAGYRAPVR
jgi:Ca-activated chloride channel family protein